MTNPEIDPVDHHRTTRPHAGESMKNGANAIGIVSVGLGVVALFVGLFALATGHLTVGIAGVVIGFLLGAAGLVWLRRAHRRVREAELQWHEAHSDEPAPPPAS